MPIPPIADPHAPPQSHSRPFPWRGLLWSLCVLLALWCVAMLLWDGFERVEVGMRVNPFTAGAVK